ncbi:hypothetical protein A1O3_04176 [Capronia epimyces CBS 606.96]|uniref:Xylanolytic transcriptional activator regulatory domain-containing protein n=1 Tax=Capronia epimyces CBS 606.96 TaxID=1182542 RepID=W9Y319_9EURO|nr:uncharacterized protein A1O3_04176 [Capronia epimyces CBS 606.96]EXJ87217.1 hypothetical protein A1O3_04176 [Capronia epimyces CBS 606.96]
MDVDDSTSQSQPGLYSQLSPSHLKAEEIRYLQAIRVFDVPKDPIIKALLTAYIKHVHYFFPVLDLRAFLESVLLHRGKDQDSDPDPDPRRRVSLVLLHAVLAAGLVYVEQDVVKQAGWSTREGFRTDLLRRVKALYHMDYEHDQLVLCQISLLVSLAEEDPDRPDESRRWLDLAWLHLQSSSSSSTTSTTTTVSDSLSLGWSGQPKPKLVPQAAIWRRLWWACYVQDRRLAVAARRPALHPSGSDPAEIPQLSRRDFEVRCHSTMITEAFPSLPMLRSAEVQEELIRLCIAHNELYTHLDCITRCEGVTFAHGPWAWGPRQRQDSKGALRQNQHQKPLLTYDYCYHRLFGWVKTHAHYVLRKHSFGQTDKTVLARYIELQIMSTSALNLLISSRLSPSLSPSPSSPSASASPSNSTTEPQSAVGGIRTGIGTSDIAAPNINRPAAVFKLLQSATDVSNAFITLETHGLLHCMSPGVLQLLMPAAAIYFQQCSSPTGTGRPASLWRLSQCLGVFGRMRTTYPSAETASAFLEKSIAQWMASGGSLSHLVGLDSQGLPESNGDGAISQSTRFGFEFGRGASPSTSSESRLQSSTNENQIQSSTINENQIKSTTTTTTTSATLSQGPGPGSIAGTGSEISFFDPDMIRPPSLVSSDGLEESTPNETISTSYATPSDLEAEGQDQEQDREQNQDQDQDQHPPRWPRDKTTSLPQHGLSLSPAASAAAADSGFDDDYNYEPLVAWHASEFSRGYIVMSDTGLGSKDDIDLNLDLDLDAALESDVKCIAPSQLTL